MVNTQGETLGVVSELLATGAANDVLVVRRDKTERLIPFVGAYVLEVDLPGKTIRVDWGWTTDDGDRRRHPVPEMFSALTASGVTRRALEQGIWALHTHYPGISPTTITAPWTIALMAAAPAW